MGTLCQVADKLVESSVDIQEACRIAEETTAGTTRLVGGIPGRVLNSTSTVHLELAELAAYVQRHSKQDPRRWAGTLLMVHAQLGAGNIASVYSLIRRVVEVSGGICPPEATAFATAMIDALLSWSKFLRKDEIEWLQEARSGFRRSKSRTEGKPISSKSTHMDRGKVDGIGLSEGGFNDLTSARPILILKEDTEAAVLQFIRADGVGELYDTLRDHPELLEDSAVDQMQLVMDYQVHAAAKRKLAERVALLRRCRSLGVDQVFREYFRSEASDDSRPPTGETKK